MKFLLVSDGKEGQVSFLGDCSSHGGAYGPPRCGRQLLDFCIQPPDYPLHGFTALWENKHNTLVHNKENYINLKKKKDKKCLQLLKKNNIQTSMPTSHSRVCGDEIRNQDLD